MKKLKFFSLLAGFVLGACFFAACGDDDEDSPKVPGAEEATVDNLVGTWETASPNWTTTYVFTKTKLTISYEDNGATRVSYEGEYSVQDGYITWTDGEYTSRLKPGLLLNKSVLVLKYVETDGDGVEEYEELAEILFKKGKSINTTASDIYGEWHWYMHGNKEYIRVGWKFEGNKFELVITPWGEKYTGTYTYTDGLLHLNTTAGYTSREEGTGNGWGEGDLDPSTLEGTWRTLDKGNWHIDAADKGPFIANGDEAYGNVANLNCIYYKKK